MATKLRKRIARALNDALLKRDRAEMRAVDSLLSLAGSPRRRRPRGARGTTARRGRRR
jgi:hypothetical protein